MADLASLDRRHLWHPFTQHTRWASERPLIVDRAQGCTLYDIDGNGYLDGVSSLWTNVHGHGHPHLDAAVRAQLDKVAHTTMLGLSSSPAIRLAARLAEVTPPGLSRVFFSDNGSTATEVALKMAFQYHQQTGQPHRVRFAGLRDGYHGDTLGAVAVGSIDVFHAVYRPLLFDAVALPAPVTPGGAEEAGCLERSLALLEAHGDTLAAVIVEPLVQGAAGMKMHTVDYLRPLLVRARELGALVIADEVAVGFARLGTMFAMDQVGVAPDLLCMAKGLAGGYLPLAATAATEAVYEAFLGGPAEHRQFFHGHTFTGNPLACAAALASLEVFEQDDVLEHVGGLARHLGTRLEALAQHPCVGEVRHRGVMAGIDLRASDGSRLDPALASGHQVAMACRPRGAIIRPLGDTLVINPPLAMTLEELDRLVDAVAGAIDATLR